MFATLTETDGSSVLLNTDHVLLCAYTDKAASEVTIWFTESSTRNHITVKGKLEDIKNELNGAQFQQRY